LQVYKFYNSSIYIRIFRHNHAREYIAIHLFSSFIASQSLHYVNYTDTSGTNIFLRSTFKSLGPCTPSNWGTVREILLTYEETKLYHAHVRNANWTAFSALVLTLTDLVIGVA
jgi:hypothetical protein